MRRPWTASRKTRSDRGDREGGDRGDRDGDGRPSPGEAAPRTHRGAADAALLDPVLLRQLELLSLDSLGAVLSPLEGEHPGALRARLGELADYRAYQPGDDLRLIDWNAYARLEELYVRTSAAHEGMLLTVLIDCSRSMAVPGAAGAVPPLLHAKRLAAAFGAVALLHGDAVRVCALADGTAVAAPALSGRAAVSRLLRELTQMPAGDRTDLPGSVRACLPAATRDLGPTVLLSDLLVPGSQASALELLAPAGAVVHVTDASFPGDPAGAGGAATVELRDAETGEIVTVTVTPALRRAYERRAGAHAAALAARCAAAGLRYIPASTATPVADLLFSDAGLPVRR